MRNKSFEFMVAGTINSREAKYVWMIKQLMLIQLI
jgi:hypothetical protein